MFEKVNPSHPDKIADRIAGALVDIAYAKNKTPKIAAEVLIGHGHASVYIETSENITDEEVKTTVLRLYPSANVFDILVVKQDEHLAENQKEKTRCGDNGIFKGCPVTDEQRELTEYMKQVYSEYSYDGKAVITDGKITLCQSNTGNKKEGILSKAEILNPLGPWTGGPEVDTGATNRKLGSDLGDGITGGGIHGKDLSKADVSVNVFLHDFAQRTGITWYGACSIGDDKVIIWPEGSNEKFNIKYEEIVEAARDYISRVIGGFEKLAEWGLIR